MSKFPKFSAYQILLITSAVAALSGLAVPRSWAEVLSPAFIFPAAIAVASTIAGILSRAPKDKNWLNS